jgi:hypothetical protein
MKDSGAPWLGEVPEHWKVERLKSLMCNVVEQTSNRQAGDLYIALEHVESWTGHSDKQNARIEHDKALQRVIIELLKDHTELFKQFTDNPMFKKWLSDNNFSLTYNEAAG